MKILIATSEIAELAPVGGIAEYVLGLARALIRAGHDVRVAVPAYDFLRERAGLKTTVDRLVVPMGTGATYASAVRETIVEERGSRPAPVRVLVLGAHPHFASVRTPGQVYDWPNHEPWVAFSRAVVAFLEHWDWVPDVIHCQDAHTAMIPVYLRSTRETGRRADTRPPRTVLTVHNLLNQGAGHPSLLDYAGLSRDWFHLEAFAHHHLANCFKAGLLSADHVTTVSRTYADEIRSSPNLGFGLEGVLRAVRHLTGIVNGIDDERWRFAGLDYSRPSAAVVRTLKSAARIPLFENWGWRLNDTPVVAFRGRWDHQKNVSLLVSATPSILRRARVIVCTWGAPGGDEQLQRAWAALQNLASEHPQRLLLNPPGVSGVDQTAFQYAVADFLLMPSRTEPCGLIQMESQRFGTIPVVRRTGGLADTVFEEPTVGIAAPNGFVFDENSPEALVAALDRACARWSAGTLDDVIQNTLRQGNDWSLRVGDYQAVFASP